MNIKTFDRLVMKKYPEIYNYIFKNKFILREKLTYISDNDNIKKYIGVFPQDNDVQCFHIFQRIVNIKLYDYIVNNHEVIIEKIRFLSL